MAQEGRPTPATESATAESATAESAAAGPASDRRTPAQIEADIEARRVRLAATVDEIADKVDPRSAVKRARGRITGSSSEGGPGVAAAAGAVVGVLVLAWALRRRRR